MIKHLAPIAIAILVVFSTNALADKAVHKFKGSKIKAVNADDNAEALFTKSDLKKYTSQQPITIEDQDGTRFLLRLGDEGSYWFKKSNLVIRDANFITEIDCNKMASREGIYQSGAQAGAGYGTHCAKR